MKKIVFFVLALSMVFCLSACGSTGERTLSEIIEEIENFKLPGLREASASDTSVAAADAVSGGDSASAVDAVSSPDSTEETEEYMSAAVHELLVRSLVGEWSELSDSLPLFRPIVSWFGSLIIREDGTFSSSTTTGTWELSEDGTQITLHGTRGSTLIEIVQDGSYTKLSMPELHLNFFRSEELDTYIKERFVLAKISMENIREYLNKPVNIGIILDEKDKPTGDTAWVIGSSVFSDGLVYYGRSEDFRVMIQNNAEGSRNISIPYDTLSLATGASFGNIMEAEGTLVFIRQEYVTDNRMTDARTRTLTLSDGTTHSTSLTWYSDLADYTDWAF